MKWISVKEKLPEIGDEVIGYDSNVDEVTQMFYGSYTQKLIGGKFSKKITFYSYEDCCGRYEYDYVTHWMPLPPCPDTK
jgi:hypothetical protein